ncbi:hypothetical protein [Crateriforma conspicua]|uniref:Uncharacterized protein n=1 Tax=Crateriforma conspicua TaxID=2527996 RepID=A0A5C5Y031_9PLAN|nr:hypothetical protein [Crateriforma conspicua]TWT68600.1 hypothetical protein Pan14r_08470 [Crateriforma conspicua]
MRRRTSPIWSRWELNPPAFTLRDAKPLHHDQFAILRRLRLVKPTTPATELQCKDCGEHQPVIYSSDREGNRHGFIVCEGCGPAEVLPESLDQFVFDTEQLLEHLFADTRLAINPVVSDLLWQIGRRTYKGQSRELLFLRCVNAKNGTSIVEQLGRRTRSLVFTPLTSSAARLDTMVSNLVIGIQDVVEFSEDGLQIDWEAVEDRLIESSESNVQKPKPQPRRSSRTAKIELLVNELTQHLRSAADHAHASGELLPRPTQQELARRTNMSKSDVSRCLKDSSADQLRLLWQTANDLDAVLRLPRRQLR